VIKAGEMESRTVLDVANLSVSFGKINALKDVSLQVQRNQIVGLIGPNGAGKTTLIDALTGFVPASGRITLGSVVIDHLPAHRRAWAGLARTWQAADLFEELTVQENLCVIQHRLASTLTRGKGETLSGSASADRVLDKLGLTQFGGVLPSSLSEGHRKLVGVGRALASDPTVLLLDEPAAGLNSAESAALGTQIQSMSTESTSVLLIDHDMNLVLSICDYIIVLDFGRVIFAGSPDEVRRDKAVIAAYLGTESSALDATPGEKGDRDA
jgi:branched-chain amino acid transport system ATP-binding protein